MPRILGVYGRMTAREPHRALILGGVLALFACGGLMPWAAAQHDAASVFEPWAYLDVATSPVARRAWHTQAALGPRPTTLSVLVSPCNTSRSVLEGAVLPPLISLNNAIVDSGGASDYERICNVRHGADGATRCSAESILSILNPSSVDAASHIDGTSRLWTPAAPTAPAMTSAASHMSPYEVRVRELLGPALLARGGISARYDAIPAATASHHPISSLPTPSVFVGGPAGGGGAYAASVLVGLVHQIALTLRDGAGMLARGSAQEGRTRCLVAHRRHPTDGARRECRPGGQPARRLGQIAAVERCAALCRRRAPALRDRAVAAVERRRRRIALPWYSVELGGRRPHAASPCGAVGGGRRMGRGGAGDA